MVRYEARPLPTPALGKEWGVYDTATGRFVEFEAEEDRERAEERAAAYNQHLRAWEASR